MRLGLAAKTINGATKNGGRERERERSNERERGDKCERERDMIMCCQFNGSHDFENIYNNVLNTVN